MTLRGAPPIRQPLHRAREESNWVETSAGVLAVHRFWPPAGTPHRRIGVLVVPGMAHEERTMAAGIVALCRALAARGVPCVLPDLQGTGQSSADQVGADGVATWLADLSHSADLLRDAGITRLALVGVRFGALLACAASATLAPSAVAVWSPVASGRRYGRELLLLERSTVSEQFRSEGGIEIGGFNINRDLVAGLRSYDLADADLRTVERLLVVDTPARLPESVAAFGERPFVIDQRSSPGTDGWLFAASDAARHPVDDLSAVADWLVADESLVTAPLHLPSLPAEREFERDGRRIRERFVRLAPGGLSGVVLEPVDRDEQRLPMLLVSTMGPGRTFVPLARDEAARGRSSLRYDFAGYGTSEETPTGEPTPLYGKASGDDVHIGLLALHRLDTRPVSLVGYCAGAWASLMVVDEQDVAGVVALNVALYMKANATEGWQSWAEAAVDRLHPQVGRLRRRLQARLGQLRPGPAVGWVQRLCTRGVCVSMIFATTDPGFHYLQRIGGVPSLGDVGTRLTVTGVDGLGHLLEGEAGRTEMIDAVRRELDRIDTATSVRGAAGS